MRQTMIWAATAALGATPLAAQASNHGDGLAPGEVALHVVAHGEVTTPADRIVITVIIPGRGADAATARAASQATAASVTRALVAAGIARSAIVVSPPGSSAVVVPPPIVAVPAPPAPPRPVSAGTDAGMHPAPVASITRTATATTTMTVTIGSRGDLDRVSRGVEGEGQSISGKPAFSLVDAADARRAATIAALARARSDADVYAAALGLRVARTVAVSNTASLGEGIEDIADVFSRLGQATGAPGTVATRATAAVDYVLVPAR